jgi:hypothetical protein
MEEIWQCKKCRQWQAAHNDTCSICGASRPTGKRKIKRGRKSSNRKARHEAE